MKYLKYCFPLIFLICLGFLSLQSNFQIPEEILMNFAKNRVQEPFVPKSSGIKVKTSQSAFKNTQVIQTALDQNKVVLLPNEVILIDSKGISLNSNNVLIFDTNTVLKLEATSVGSYQILRVKNVNNVKIFSPKLIGDRYEHRGNSGEWGMGIAITGSNNVQIYNANISKTWGDGIYIGKSKIASSNVSLYNTVIDQARRNGISITCGRDIKIQNAIISRTDGTNPKAGIDIEPNNNNDIIENINLTGINTFRNKSHGIITSLSGLVGKEKRDVSIIINDHTDYGSKAGFAIGATGKRGIKDGYPVGGFVKIQGSKYVNNYYKGIEIYKALYNSIDLQIDDPVIINNNKLDIKSINEYQLKVKEYYKK